MKYMDCNELVQIILDTFSNKNLGEFLMQQLIYPKKIIFSNNLEGTENLLLKQPDQIDLYEAHTIKTKNGSAVILDFGKEMRGGIRILVFSSDRSLIRVRFGESVAECCSELGSSEKFAGAIDSTDSDEKTKRQNATNDHAMRDFSLKLPSWSDTPIADTGFRFVRLDFSGTYVIKSVICVNHILSRRAKYTYRGDRDIEKIFSVAKRTVDLCASSGFIWDGIKRDRLVWAGDLSPEVLALTALYGRTNEVEKSLDFLRKQNVVPRWMDGKPTYSLWWIICLRDYLQRTNARDFVEKQLDYMEEMLKAFSDGVDENGDSAFQSYFLDWPHANTKNEKEGAHALFIMASKAAISILEAFGRNTSAVKKLLEKLERRSIRANTRVVAALKYFAVGCLDEKEQSILLANGVAGVSTFMSYYVLRAVWDFDQSKATAMMKEYFGAMLRFGATTFWEDFTIEWQGTPIDVMPEENKKDIHGDFGAYCYKGFRHSLCHGWSAGVIAFIKEQIDQ